MNLARLKKVILNLLKFLTEKVKTYVYMQMSLAKQLINWKLEVSLEDCLNDYFSC